MQNHGIHPLARGKPPVGGDLGLGRFHRRNEDVDLLLRRVKTEGSAGRAIFEAEARMQRFGAMPPRAHRNACAVEQRGKVVRMRGIEGELYICDGEIFEKSYDFVQEV